MSGGSGSERIQVYGSKVLRRSELPLPVGTAETKALLDSLWETLQADGGVGLAAPQIGASGRACVVRDPGGSGSGARIDLVNPVLKKAYGDWENFEEGCLSFPGLYFNVLRRRGAVIEFQDAEGVQRRIKDGGLLARILQHELDHLDGILFIDRIPAWQRFWLGPRLLWMVVAGFLARKWNGK
ncbi:MAG: peptide deformylase [Gemmatimonadales bacterium]|nr:peptide deformylase [Gemmatimonadales bacterium]